MNNIAGNCLCGAVGFEVNDDFQQLNICHCKQCQRATGSAHASNLFTDPSNIRWVRGTDYVRRFDVPGRSISNAFCIKCGSGLPYASRTGKSLIVPAGTLNDVLVGHPRVRNIFWSERADWYEAATAAEHHDGFPE